jgi:hypothetical protein
LNVFSKPPKASLFLAAVRRRQEEKVELLPVL